MKGGFRKRCRRPMILMGKSIIRDYFRMALDLLYPPEPICPLCGRVHHTSGILMLCDACLERVALIRKPICDRCGRPIRGESHSPCPECVGRRFFYSHARAVGLYQDYFRQTILAMKYRGRPELAEPLAQLMVERVKGDKALHSVDTVVSVPLHANRWMERGYNQAELLARYIGQHCHLSLASEAISRVRVTGVQNKLTREERFTNVADAFTVSTPGKVSGRKILLIDDILTTGSTASECAKVLLAAGAVTVDVLTLAVGVVEEQWMEDNEHMEE